MPTISIDNKPFDGDLTSLEISNKQLSPLTRRAWYHKLSTQRAYPHRVRVQYGVVEAERKRHAK
jgi:hypothetical protein